MRCSCLLTLTLLIDHFERCHKHEENLHIVRQATRSSSVYHNIEDYKTHLRRKHRDILHAVIEEQIPEKELHIETDLPTNNGGSIQIVNDIDAPRSDEPRDGPENGDGQHDILDENTVRKLNAVYLYSERSKRLNSPREQLFIL